jgi:hypothetical protein
MKKKILFIATLVGMSMFTSCHRFDFEEARQEAIRQNAEKVFGDIDPNQTWSSTVSGTVTITADASLKEIARVQILTESPFMNPNARVVADAQVQKGQTVTLNYDVLNSYNRLIAACVDSKGHYHIKGFDIGETNVSFKSGTTRAARRAASNLPDLSGVGLDFDESIRSYNAQRTLDNKNSWKGKGWENDRLWWATGSASSNGWTMSNATFYRDATALSESEAATLTDIFEASLGRYEENKDPKNNLQLINETSAVQLYGNHLESTGETPITLRPVQLASTEAHWCDIYYYYFRTEDIPAGATEADYIKTLPKFKAIDLHEERQAFSTSTGVAVDKPDVNFRRLHEYLLPFYGNASEFAPEPSKLSSYGYTTDGKFYRIYNYSGNSKAKVEASNHYITYNESHDKNLKDEYTDDIEYQLWQIFTNATDNSMMLYNVGGKKFMWWDNGNWVEMKDIAENSLKNYTVYLTDGAKTPYEYKDITNQKVFILSAAKNNFVKAMIDAGRAYLYKGGTNISGDFLFAREWTFEKYDYSGSASAITDLELSLDYFPAGGIIPPSTTPSAIIPEGYKIGFMIRKDGGERTGEGDSNKQGCLYGYGELNTEINTWGQFKTAVEKFGMANNDPRMATFAANGKTYLTFEEGADAQFSDVILEMGGYDTESYDSDPNGNDEGKQSVVTNYLYEEEESPTAMTYTLMFEDRSASADYDMNDVVLRCSRYSDDPSCVELTLVAAGGTDDVIIRGIEGTLIEDGGIDFNGKEVHKLFGVANAVGYDRFVNTMDDKPRKSPRLGIYKIADGLTIPQFLAKIYIDNQTTGIPVTVPRTGEAPLAIIMPYDFEYPKERESIVDAYKKFLNWAQNVKEYSNWYEEITPNTVYPIENLFK